MKNFKEFVLEQEEILDNYALVEEDLSESVLNENAIYNRIEKALGHGHHVSEKMPEFEDMLVNKLGQGFYFKEGSRQFHIHNYSSNVYFTDITDGMERGKTVTTISINSRSHNAHISAALDSYAYNKGYTSAAKLYDDLAKEKTVQLTPEDEAQIYLRKDKGVNVLNPFKLAKLKRLKKIPNKIKHLDVVKALVNGQIDSVTRDYSYTDDYALDAVYGGEIKNIDPLWLGLEMFGDKWHVYGQKEYTENSDVVAVSVGPHSNQSYTIFINLKAKHRLKV